MEGILIEKLHGYLVQNHPDLLVTLSSESKITNYLHQRVESLENLPSILLAEGKPTHVVEEICMEALTRDLRPSKFIFLCSFLQEHFEATYYEWLDGGFLTYEVINLLEICKPVFDHFGFNEGSEGDRPFCYCLMGSIQEYMNSN
ncbi:MAG: hypothetical protein BGO55_06170 [Sphingobacteriales bacterium 50-39]|nr:hypothetical protein [Sphingobacteriales bacterium]OJW52849.1 MAG: hypothetical protein BGO55_06170 [Sphingobacteriales bacterium 50-39]